MRPSRLSLPSALVLSLCLVPFALAAAGPVVGSADRLASQAGASLRLRLDGIESTHSLPEDVRIEGVVALAAETLLCGVRAPQPGADELFLALADSERLRELSPPPARLPGAMRENPVGIADPRGELAAVAWLEGPSRRENAVRVSAWNGQRFEEPLVVAPAGPGSQSALAAATLDDGAALLLWARFDGADDEIFWARRSGGAWSEPARVAADNAVPDVVPTLVAVPGGALAAWSRYENGQYRVVVARYADGAWGAPHPLGEPGSLFPTLTRTASGALLLHQSSRPLGWTVVELSAEGREIRQARVDSAERGRPVATPERLLWADGSVELAWRESGADPRP